MTIEMQVEKPFDVRVTLTCTMTVSQWQVLAAVLKQGEYDSDAAFFADCVRDGIDKVKKNVLGDPRLR